MTEADVPRAVMRINSNAAGADEFPIKILKLILPVITAISLINLIPCQHFPLYGNWLLFDRLIKYPFQKIHLITD